MPAPGIDPLRRGITRFNTWVEPCEPLTYRDAWRYSVLFPGLLLPQAGAHFVLGNAIWPALLALVFPVRSVVVAAGPAGILLVWLLVLFGLFGFALPEYGPAVFDSHSDGNSARSEP